MTTAAALRGDEADLFAEHHDGLLRSVKRAVNAPEAMIEDACQFAWTQLIRTQPERGPRLFGWLRTVAIHEAYRLSWSQRRDTALEDLAARQENGGSIRDEWEALIEGSVDLDSQLEAKRGLSILASLPERESRYLTLFVAGYRYQEIARLTGATYTNVNKHLTRARARVRDQELAA